MSFFSPVRFSPVIIVPAQVSALKRRRRPGPTSPTVGRRARQIRWIAWIRKIMRAVPRVYHAPLAVTAAPFPEAYFSERRSAFLGELHFQFALLKLKCGRFHSCTGRKLNKGKTFPSACENVQRACHHSPSPGRNDGWVPLIEAATLNHQGWRATCSWLTSCHVFMAHFMPRVHGSLHATCSFTSNLSWADGLWHPRAKKGASIPEGWTPPCERRRQLRGRACSARASCASRAGAERPRSQDGAGGTDGPTRRTGAFSTLWHHHRRHPRRRRLCRHPRRRCLRCRYRRSTAPRQRSPEALPQGSRSARRPARWRDWCRGSRAA